MQHFCLQGVLYGTRGTRYYLQILALLFDVVVSKSPIRTALAYSAYKVRSPRLVEFVENLPLELQSCNTVTLLVRIQNTLKMTFRF